MGVNSVLKPCGLGPKRTMSYHLGLLTAAVEPDAVDNEEEGEEYKETITISASNLVAL